MDTTHHHDARFVFFVTPATEVCVSKRATSAIVWALTNSDGSETDRCEPVSLSVRRTRRSCPTGRMHSTGIIDRTCLGHHRVGILIDCLTRVPLQFRRYIRDGGGSPEPLPLEARRWLSRIYMPKYGKVTARPLESKVYRRD